MAFGPSMAWPLPASLIWCPPTVFYSLVCVTVLLLLEYTKLTLTPRAFALFIPPA